MTWCASGTSERLHDRSSRLHRATIFSLWLAAATMVAVPHLTAQDAPQSPAADSVAYVATKVALVRSGPGFQHYPTDALLLADSVQIVERQDEWVGIRPPQDSFCWVSASSLRMLNDREATVVEDDVKAWLGSHITEVEQHAHQIQMRRGERVAIAGQKEVTDDSGQAATWVRIRPPVGEVRWVRGTELSETPPAIPAAQAASVAARPSADGWTDRHAASSSSSSVLDQALPAERAATRGRRASPVMAHESMGSFEDRLANLQLALSRAAAKSADYDQWATLEAQTESLLQAGSSPFERGRVHRLLETVKEFRELAEAKEELDVDQGVDVADAANDEDTDDEPIGSGVADDSPYEAKGWLVSVSSPAGAAPPFAVVDRDGRPQAFLSPAPGVNLRRYLDREVGVIGKESFDVVLKDQHHRHIVAHQLIDLSRNRSSTSDAWKLKIPWITSRPPRPE